MKIRVILAIAVAFSIGLAGGCTSKEEKQPKAETTPGTPKLEQKTPGMGGPGGKGPAAPGPQPQ